VGQGGAVRAILPEGQDQLLEPGMLEVERSRQRAGVRVALHSDSPWDIQRLNQEAAKAMAAGRRAGIPVEREAALRWITANPAWILGVDARVGTLEPGKDADLVVWSGDPFSVYARAEQVYIEGNRVFDRANPGPPRSDFELGSRGAK